MSSWDFDAPQYIDFNKQPKEENIDSYFDLDHEDKAVNDLANAMNSSKLSDDHHCDNSVQPLVPMLQDKASKLEDSQSCDDEYIPSNVCASQKEWNNNAKVPGINAKVPGINAKVPGINAKVPGINAKVPGINAKVPINSVKPSRNSRPTVALVKSKSCRQNSPCRSPLAKRMRPTCNHPKRSSSDQQKMFTRSQSAVALPMRKETQGSGVFNDNQLEAGERRSLWSSMEPLSSSEKGEHLCSERSHSLPSVAQLSQNCLNLRSTQSNPAVLGSRADVGRQSKLASGNEQTASDAKSGKKNLSRVDKVSHGHVTGGATLKSSEQLWLEKMEELKKDLERKRKISQMSMLKALAAHNQPEIHSSREATKPVEFHFATDNRFKEPTKENNSGPLHQEKTFAMLLRQPDPQLQTTRPKGLTVVQPFNLSGDKKRKREDPKEANPTGYKFQTMGEKLLQFCTKTPERFRRKKGQTDPPSPVASDVGSRRTIPKTPNLTKTRHRKVDALSHEEQEELEVQEMKKHQFKALPLNKKILDQQDQLKSIPVRPPTAFEPFKLTTVLRRSEGNLASNEETRYEFHAQPIPKAVFEPDFVKKEVFKCTIPQSPAFSWKKNPPRASRVSESCLVKEEPMFKPPPVPKFDEPFHPVLPHRCTEPQPFSFEERMKETLAKKEKAFQMILEEEARAREFVANPIPDLSPVLPKKRNIPVTDPVPFNFLVDERGAEKAKRFEEMIEEENRRSHEAATFRAQPVTVLYRDPFVPQKLAHHSVEPEPFHLETEERNAQRTQWKMWKKEKEEEEVLQRQDREQRRLEEEEAEVQQIRQETVHRANPIRRYKPLEAREILPMTEPHSPNFSERLKPRK